MATTCWAILKDLEPGIMNSMFIGTVRTVLWPDTLCSNDGRGTHGEKGTTPRRQSSSTSGVWWIGRRRRAATASAR